MKPLTHNNNFIFDRPVIINRTYLKHLFLYPFYNCFFHFLVKLYYPRKITNRRYTLSVCAIFKDEAPILREWIEYHIIAGVEHFYLYNNFSSDDFAEILEPYIESGLVTLIEWHIDKGQIPAYVDCWENYRDETQWLAYIDLDEFICPYYETDIKKWLQHYSKYPSVRIYWKMFGTSGKIDHDSETLVTEQYTVCWDKMDTVGKVIVNTNWNLPTSSINMHHLTTPVVFFNRTWNIPSINEFKKFIVTDDIHKTSKRGFTIQINHYWTKSFNEMVTRKFMRGDAYFGDLKPTRNLDVFFAHEIHNRSVDFTIYRYLIKLKIALGMDKASSDE